MELQQKVWIVPEVKIQGCKPRKIVMRRASILSKKILQLYVAKCNQVSA